VVLDYVDGAGFKVEDVRQGSLLLGLDVFTD
jgi:hypothetical protein